VVEQIFINLDNNKALRNKKKKHTIVLYICTNISCIIGISRDQYREAVRDSVQLDWICQECQTETAEAEVRFYFYVIAQFILLFYFGSNLVHVFISALNETSKNI